MTLYQRLLGADFAKMPAVLRRFHAATGNSQARGWMTITRFPGRCRRLLADWLGLPPAGHDVPLDLHVHPSSQGECWRRRFGRFRLDTSQRERHGLLLESAGLWTLGFAVHLEGLSMNFDLRRCWFCGLPVPRAMAPGVQTRVRADETAWQVKVTVTAPWFGTLVRYEGRVTPV